MFQSPECLPNPLSSMVKSSFKEDFFLISVTYKSKKHHSKKFDFLKTYVRSQALIWWNQQWRWERTHKTQVSWMYTGVYWGQQPRDIPRWLKAVLLPTGRLFFCKSPFPLGTAHMTLVPRSCFILTFHQKTVLSSKLCLLGTLHEMKIQKAPLSKYGVGGQMKTVRGPRTP